jgi:hypothetical protein
MSGDLDACVRLVFDSSDAFMLLVPWEIRPPKIFGLRGRMSSRGTVKSVQLQGATTHSFNDRINQSVMQRITIGCRHLCTQKQTETTYCQACSCNRI